MTDPQPESPGRPTGGSGATGGSIPCAWCGRPVDQPAQGRRRKYCKRSCRQRAYESRHRAEDLGLPEGAMVLSEAETSAISERAFVLRCAAEDLQTAVEEGAGREELVGLAAELVRSAKEAERLR